VGSGFWNLLSFSIADGDGWVVQAMRWPGAPAFKRKLSMLAGVAKTPAKPFIPLLSFVRWRVGVKLGALVGCWARFSLVKLRFRV